MAGWLVGASWASPLYADIWVCVYKGIASRTNMSWVSLVRGCVSTRDGGKLVHGYTVIDTDTGHAAVM